MDGRKDTIRASTGRLAIRVLDEVMQRLRREAESQDNIGQADKLNRLAAVLEELRNEEENVIERGFAKRDGSVCEQNP
jgi:hypothetical protein